MGSWAPRIPINAPSYHKWIGDQTKGKKKKNKKEKEKEIAVYNRENKEHKENNPSHRVLEHSNVFSLLL